MDPLDPHGPKVEVQSVSLELGFLAALALVGLRKRRSF